jgi:hypothetical protein
MAVTVPVRVASQVIASEKVQLVNNGVAAMTASVDRDLC